MARNCEKAQAMLNRWWTMKRELHKNPENFNRPKSIQKIMTINSLNECEKWRNSCLKEISKKVTLIQNAGLGEHKIRFLNDEINKLIQEKAIFEDRIYELGGPNYKKIIGSKGHDTDGVELPGFGGYKYFGAAKDLPGVRELFYKQKPEAPQKAMVQIIQGLDLNEYYGKKDNSEELLKIEKEQEEKDLEYVYQRWIAQHSDYIKLKFGNNEPAREQIMVLINEETQEQEDTEQEVNQKKNEEQQQIQEDSESVDSQLEDKKRKLLDKYVYKTINIKKETDKEDNEDQMVKDMIEMNKNE